MKRQDQILALVLVAQIILAGALFWPRAAASGGSTPLFPGLTTDKVTRLTIHDGSGQQVQLAKVPAGWVLSQADDYPCQATKVSSMLSKLVVLKTDRPVTQTEGSLKRLKVADQSYERLVELELSDGSRSQFYLGVPGGSGATHVRLQGRVEVYLATGLAVADVPALASGWVDTLYFSVPPEQVQALTVQNKGGTLDFEKDQAGAWTLKGLAAGEKANVSAIQTLLSQATAVSLLQPLGKTEQASYGLKTPGAVVTLQTRDQAGAAKTITLRVGTPSAQDGSYVLSSSASPYYVRAAAYTVQDLVNKARNDYLQLPTPAPAPQPAPKQ
jgi:hypothetical protein